MSASRLAGSLPGLVEQARAGDRRCVARLLTLTERGGEAADRIADLTHPHQAGAHVIGVTGAPGSGKSTLVGRVLTELVGRGRRPAVLAVDPSSPLSGGAILGDRIRMDAEAVGEVFIRSLATRGHQGGLALAVPGAIRVFDACGFDPIIVETVGVGQVEVDVANSADTTVVVVAPGMGDGVQANKAGLLEVADVFVVNKADRPGADVTRRDLEQMLHLSQLTGHTRTPTAPSESTIPEPAPPQPVIVMTVATNGTGTTDLIAAVDQHLLLLEQGGLRATRAKARIRQEVLMRVSRQMTNALEHHANKQGQEILQSAQKGKISAAQAAKSLTTSLLSSDHHRPTC